MRKEKIESNDDRIWIEIYVILCSFLGAIIFQSESVKYNEN